VSLNRAPVNVPVPVPVPEIAWKLSMVASVCSIARPRCLVLNWTINSG
jgi:hypothetical protein